MRHRPLPCRPPELWGAFKGGYNWQFGSAVVGFEADANWLGGTGSQSLAGISGAPGDSLTDSISSTFLLTARPRLGWAWDRTLVFVTGGYAWANVNVSDAAMVAGGTIAAGSSNSPHLNGWTVGAGIEYAFARSWSVKGTRRIFVNSVQNTFFVLSRECTLGGGGSPNNNSRSVRPPEILHLCRSTSLPEALCRDAETRDQSCAATAQHRADLPSDNAAQSNRGSRTRCRDAPISARRFRC
jgi:hypothetical protein